MNYSSLPVLSGLLSGLKSFCSEPNQPKPATEIPPMNNKSISPNLLQPVDRVPTGQLPSALAELSEAQLDGGIGSSAGPGMCMKPCLCSYDGDDE